MSAMDFSQQYQRQVFLDFLRQQFLPEDFSVSEEEMDLEFAVHHIDSVIHLGQCPDLNLNVYEIHHQSEHDPRVTLTKETFRLMKSYRDFNALAVFVSGNSQNYRLSYVTMGLKEEGDQIAYEQSNPRRYSYFLGPDAKINTPTRFLANRGRVTDMDDLRGRFSVEVVNREFYNSVALLFTKLVGGSRRVRNRVETHPTQLLLPSQIDPDVFKEFTVRLMGRAIFCWFLKKKTVETADGRQPLIPDEILSLDAVQAQPGYYHNVLEKLFFQVLNKKQDERLTEFLSDLPFEKIPFLNGGLFEPHPDDFYMLSQSTGLSEHLNTVSVPDQWLVEFFELLETYNFTIDENTSMDVELSVDPEMLGRIFENLLAELNPETGETARKSTGSYYTPRPIVEYMVDQSLMEYLKTKTGMTEKRLDCLLSFSREFENPTDEEREAVNRAVDELKIIDPACGSGAFPMGVLQKLVLVLQKVDPGSKWWLERCVRDISNAVARNIVRKQLQKENVDYIHKLELIRTVIYGVDIQQVAVEISKLRVFLSLVVDTQVDPNHTEGNMGVKELPNLEFKFVCADALKGLVGIEDKNYSAGLFEAHDHIRELKRLRDDYFRSIGEDKTGIKDCFKDTQHKMFLHMLEHRDLSAKKKNNDTQTELLTEWDPFSHKQSKWFDPDWMFGVKNGFNVVISNPPYIRQEMLGIAKSYYKEHYKDVYHGVADIYVYFIANGLTILKEDGICCIIVANKWMRANYGTPLRKFLKKKRLLKLVDFGDLPVFKNATTYPCILLAANSGRGATFDACNVGALEMENLPAYLGSIQFEMKPDSLQDKGWTLVDRKVHLLLEKLKSTGVPLGEYVDGKIFYGIKTGLNKAFVIDEETRDRLIAEDARSAELIKPFLAGRDVKRYRELKHNQYLIFTRHGVNIKDYPAIEKYLYDFKEELTPKPSDYKGNAWKGRKAGPYQWYEIQDTVNYHLEFEKSKIVYPIIGKQPEFTLDLGGHYTNDKCFIILLEDQFLLAVLNSTVFFYMVTLKLTKLRGDFYEFRYIYLKDFPIPRLDSNSLYAKSQQHQLETMVAEMQELHKRRDSALTAEEQETAAEAIANLDRRIDSLVYELYNLTPEEIEIVENGIGKN